MVVAGMDGCSSCHRSTRPLVEAGLDQKKIARRGTVCRRGGHSPIRLEVPSVLRVCSVDDHRGAGRMDDVRDHTRPGHVVLLS